MGISVKELAGLAPEDCKGSHMLRESKDTPAKHTPERKLGMELRKRDFNYRIWKI